MGALIEVGVFVLVLAFAWWQFRDLRKAREEREARQREAAQREQPPGP